MALQDKIGREEIVEKVCGFVDSLQKDKNLCLAINGAWGSGKTFVLGLIEEKLSQKQEYIIIKYDAWENTFYSDPLIAILSCVIDGIEDKLYLVERKEEKTKKTVKASIQALAKLSTKIEKLYGAVKDLKGIIKDIHNPIDTTGLGDFKSYQTLLNKTKAILSEVTQAREYRGRQTKLVILVDEIDRCLPDEQLKILERLHHLFEVKNCAVIVTMNQSCVAKTVQTIYGVDGYEYLRKFFDFTFKLETSASEYLKSLFEDYIKRFENLQAPTNEMTFPVKLAYQCLLYGNKNVLDKVDNRELTRYLDVVMNVCADFGWQKLNQHYVFFILVASYIRKILSSTFLNTDEIVKNQRYIDEELNNISGEERQRTMPYYDYLSKFIGIDRKDPPEEFEQIYGWSGGHILEFSWVFNETICFSRGQDFRGNEIRRFNNQPMVKPDSCKQLCRLIIQYSGEQEKMTN